MKKAFFEWATRKTLRTEVDIQGLPKIQISQSLGVGSIPEDMIQDAAGVIERGTDLEELRFGQVGTFDPLPPGFFESELVIERGDRPREEIAEITFWFASEAERDRALRALLADPDIADLEPFPSR